METFICLSYALFRSDVTRQTNIYLFKKRTLKARFISYFFVLCLFTSLAFNLSAQTDTKTNQHAELQVQAGMNRGFGLGSNILLKNFSQGFPFEFRLGLGYTWLNPGKSADARRIFINDATNGTPEKKGHNLDLRLDLMKSATIIGHTPAYWYFGPRYSFFKGNFKYIGGNEDFDVTSKQFGIGTGIESRYQMTSKFTFVISAGLDYYFPALMKGHDTSYAPDNDNVNTRTNRDTGEKYTYKDANKAIYQPYLMPRLQLGIQWEL